MSIRAIETSDTPLGLRILRNVDLVVLALLLPVFVVAEFPLLGYGVGAAAWLLQRGLRSLIENRAKDSDDPRTVAGLLAGSMIGRGWLMALSVFGAGLVEREAGLAAAVMVLGLFTLYFSTSIVMRPLLDAPGPRGAGAAQ